MKVNSYQYHYGKAEGIGYKSVSEAIDEFVRAPSGDFVDLSVAVTKSLEQSVDHQGMMVRQGVK